MRDCHRRYVEQPCRLLFMPNGALMICGVLRSLTTPSVFACVSCRCRDGAVDIVAAGFSDNQVALYV